MPLFPPTLILRHRKENLKKCSLRGLETRPDCAFFTYPGAYLPDLSRYVLLSVDAPPLSPEDAHQGLLLIDSTWRYAKVMHKTLPPSLPCRSIPLGYQTAYPRCQEDDRGLASVEALFLAYQLLGRSTDGLLDGYYWKDPFLKNNNLEKR
jgi:pre-rRNA-processing protein TSR3